MKLVSLEIGVLISDQTGKSKNIFIGVFDNQTKLEAARKTYKEKYKDYQYLLNEKIIKVNQILTDD